MLANFGNAINKAKLKNWRLAQNPFLTEINALQIARRGNISPIRSKSSRGFPIVLDRNQSIATNNNTIQGLHKLMNEYDPKIEKAILGSTYNGKALRSPVITGNYKSVSFKPTALHYNQSSSLGMSPYPDGLSVLSNNYQAHTHPSYIHVGNNTAVGVRRTMLPSEADIANSATNVYRKKYNSSNKPIGDEITVGKSYMIAPDGKQGFAIHDYYSESAYPFNPKQRAKLDTRYSMLDREFQRQISRPNSSNLEQVIDTHNEKTANIYKDAGVRLNKYDINSTFSKMMYMIEI